MYSDQAKTLVRDKLISVQQMVSILDRRADDCGEEIIGNQWEMTGSVSECINSLNNIIESIKQQTEQNIKNSSENQLDEIKDIKNQLAIINYHLEWVNEQVIKGSPNAAQLEVSLMRLESQLANLHHQLQQSPSTNVIYTSPNVFQLLEYTQQFINGKQLGLCELPPRSLPMSSAPIQSGDETMLAETREFMEASAHQMNMRHRANSVSNWLNPSRKTGKIVPKKPRSVLVMAGLIPEEQLTQKETNDLVSGTDFHPNSPILFGTPIQTNVEQDILPISESSDSCKLNDLCSKETDSSIIRVNEWLKMTNREVRYTSEPVAGPSGIRTQSATSWHPISPKQRTVKKKKTYGTSSVVQRKVMPSAKQTKCHSVYGQDLGTIERVMTKNESVIARDFECFEKGQME